MDFGEYGAQKTTVYYFERMPAWAWRIKTVTFKEERKHDELFSGYTVRINPDGTRDRVITRTDADFAAEEIFLTFDGSNIPADTSKEPVPIDQVDVNTKGLLMPFKAKNDKARFMEILGQMPTEMVTELWTAVRRANPQWLPNFQPMNSEQTSSAE